MADDFKALLDAELDLSGIQQQIQQLNNEKITLKVEVEQDAAKRLAESIKRGVKDINVPDLSQKLADSFNIKNPKVTSQIRRQVSQLSAEMAKAFDGSKINGANLSDRFDSIFENLVQTIAHNSSAVKSQMTDFYRSFYDDYKNTMVYVSDDMKNRMGAAYTSISQSGRITRDPTKGIALDTIWDEMSTRHPDIIDARLSNAEDQVFAFIAAMRQAKTELKAALKFDDLDIDLQNEILDDAGAGVTDLANRLKSQLEQSISAAAEGLKSEFLLDVTVNTDKISADIQQALQQPNTPIDIAFNIDDTELRNKIQTAIQGISAENIPIEIDENEIRSRLHGALQNLPLEEILVTIDESELRAEIDRAVGNTTADISLNVDRTELENSIRAALSGVDFPVDFRVDEDELRNQLRAAVAGLNDLEVDVQVNIVDLQNNIRQGIQNMPPVNADVLNNINAAGRNGNDIFTAFGITLRDAFSTFTLANLLERGIDEVIEAGQQAIQTVKELDDATTDLRMATGSTKEEAKQMIADYNVLGQELGALTTEVSASADAWLRQGKNAAETEQLIKDSMVLSKVAQLSGEDSTKYLTSAMQGYKVAVDEVSRINDKLTSIDLVSATDAGGLAEAMSRTAESANIAGVSMDRLLAILATVGEVTQASMSSIGTSYKTIFARMRDIKADKLSSVGEDGEIEDISYVEETLNSLGIKLRDSNQEFRNFQTVLDDVAASWSSWSSVQQAAVAKAFAGQRQQENFLVMMENYDKVLKYTGVAANSEGTAEEKFGYYAESLEAKTKSLQASLEALAADTLTDDLYAWFLDNAKAAADFATETDIVKSALVGVGTAGSLMVFTRLATLISNTTAEVSRLGGGLSGLWGLMSAHPVALVTAAVTAGVTAWNMYQAKVQAQIDNAKKAAKSYQENSDSINQNIEKITELRAALDSGKLTEEEAYQAKSDLYSIQQSLTESYGAQAEGINLVNGSLEEQIGLLEELGVAEANRFLTENKAAIDTAVSEMEKERTFSILEDYGSGAFAADDVKKIAERYADQGLEVIDTRFGDTFSIRFTGDVTEAQDILTQFAADVRATGKELGDENGLFDYMESQISMAFNNAKEITDEYSSIYEQQRQALLVTNTDKFSYGNQSQTAAKWLSDYEKAIQKYNDALLTGDNTKISDAADAFAEVDTAIQSLLDNADFAQYAEDVTNVRDQLNDSAIAVNDFNNAVNGIDLTDSNKAVNDFANTIKDAEITDIDFRIALENPTDDTALGAAISGIAWSAEQAGISVDGLISLLTQAGMLTTYAAENLEDGTDGTASSLESLKEAMENAVAMQDNLNAAMASSVSASGLTAEEIENVALAYQHLEGYDPEKLFERTANGVHLNATELHKLDAQLKQNEMASYLQQIAEKQMELNRAKAAGEDTTALESELLTLQQLASQYDGLTSAYQRWLDAKSGGEEGDMYRSVNDTMIERGKELYSAELYNSKEFRAIADFYSNQDLTNASAEEVKAAYEKALPAIEKYFTAGREGIDAFVTDMAQLSEVEGLGWVDILQDGSIKFNTGTDQEIADRLGIDVEAVQAIYRMMSEYRDDILLGDTSSINAFTVQIEEAQEKIQQLQDSGEMSSTVDVAYNVDEMSLAEIQGKISELKEARVEIDSETNPEAAAALDDLISKTQQAYYFKLNVDTNGGLDRASAAINGIQQRISELSTENPVLSFSAIVNGDEEIQTLAEELASLPSEVQTTIGISSENVGNVDGILSQFAENPESITVPVNYTTGTEPEKVSDAVGVANYELGTSPTNVPDATGRANFILGTYPRTIPAATQFIKQIPADTESTGTMVAPAHAGGNVAIKRDEDALINEVGMESRIRDGVWELILGGPHVESLKKGDIILNAKQTDDLLKHGKTSSYGKAYASGTVARNGMSAHSSGGWSLNTSGGSNSSQKGTSGIDNLGKSADKAKSALDKLIESLDKLMDWIEVRRNYKQSRIDLRLAESENEIGYRNKNKKVAAAQNITKSLINVDEKAYDRYMKQAAAVGKKLGMSKNLMEKARTGKIDIEELTEDEKKQVEQYQIWIDKARAVRQEIEELKTSQKELAQQKLDNIITRYDGILSLFESRAAGINNDIEQAELRGFSDSGQYYTALQNDIKIMQDKRTAEIAALEASLQADIDAGIIIPESDTSRGSEEWYEMTNQIYEAKLALDEYYTQYLEYEQKLREIQWAREDQKQEAVESINDEADFLQKLMQEEDEKVYDENGNITDIGKATYGLRGLSYNVNMNQADAYAKRIAEIDAEIAKPENAGNEDLIKERERLLGLQRDSILAAEDEKQAIVDLVKDGIEAQLSALKKLIDKYKDAINSQKNLYDYQKNVKEQAEEVAKLQKRLAAYAGDDSEEGRLRRQETEKALKEAQQNLEETQYDKFISDQEELLDDMYEQYEEVLNDRLDNIDLLIENVISGINASSTEIQETLKAQAASVGITLSDSMDKIWGSEGTGMNVLTTYTDNFGSSVTTVTSAIGDVKSAVEELHRIADENANDQINRTQDDYPAPGADNGGNPTRADIQNIVSQGTAHAQKASDEEAAKHSALWTYLVNNFGYAAKEGTAKAIAEQYGIAVSDKVTAEEKDKILAALKADFGDEDAEIMDIIKSGKKRKKSLTKDEKKSKSALWQHIVTKYGYEPYDGMAKKLAPYFQVSIASDKPTDDEKNKLLAAMTARGYARGTDYVDKDEWARVFENGREIIALNDGSVIMPFERGDGVLNNAKTELLLDLANNHDAIMGMIESANVLMKYNQGLAAAETERRLAESMVVNNNAGGAQYHITNEITFELNNVHNEDEFMRWATHNKDFERLITGISIGKMNGKSSINKYR